MDLSPPAFFLYMLMVVTLYLSPVVLIALVIGWRKGHFAKTLKGVLVGLPALALIAQISFHLNLQLFSFGMQSEQAFYDENFPNDVSVYRGRVVSYKELGGFTYTRYQFDVDPFLPDSLEVLMPPADVTSAAMVKLTSPKEALAGTGAAQLVIRNAGSYYNPVDKTPKAYFQEYYPSIAGSISGDPLMILTLRAGNNSGMLQFNGLDADYPWRHQMASVDF